MISKLSSNYNEITKLPAGSPLAGAVFEVYSTAGNIVDRLVSDSRGIAASKPLPLGMYFIKEVSPPKYYGINTRELWAELKHDGDIVRFELYNESIQLGVTLQKKGNNQIEPGQALYYDLYEIANTSSVPLQNFYLHDRIPTDAVRANKLFTGTFNERLSYSLSFKTNYRDYRTLAANLSSKNDAELSLHPNVLGLMAGEYVTDIRYEFGTVQPGFKSTKNPILQVQFLPTLPSGYKVVNRAEIGGNYYGQWETAQANWITMVTGGQIVQPLPQTGY